jgi:hypothetical protein
MTDINRRAFLRRLGFGTVSAAAAALTFDVEKLLWVPGEKTIIEVVRPPVALVQKIGLSAREYQLQLNRLAYRGIANAAEIMRQSAFITDTPEYLIGVR